MAAPNSCTPCDCIPGNVSEEYFRSAALNALCQILAAVGGEGSGPVRYDWESLCSPVDGSIVFVRFEYDTDGTIVGSAGFRADGTAYVGDLNLLVACEASSVAITSVIPGVGPTNLGKAEDALAVSGDTGVFSLQVRNTALATLTSGDGDYSGRAVNAVGAGFVDVNASAQQSNPLGLLKLEDAAHASGDAGVFALAVANNSRATLSADGDYTPIAVNTIGGVLVNLDATAVISAGNQPVRLEDAAFAASDAVMMGGGVNNSNLVVFNATNGDVTPFAVSNAGLTMAALYHDSTGTISLSPIKLEDASFASGNAVMMAGAVNNRSFGAYNSTNDDVTPIAVGDKGVVLSTIMYDSSMAGGSCAVTVEDASLGEGTAIVLVGARRIDTLATNPGSDGDASHFNVNSVGALYTEQANQVVTSALGTLAFGGVTTAYATLLTNSAKGLIVSIDNKLDKDIYVSYNASTDHVFVAAGASKILDYGSNGRWVASNISVKSIGANATSGNIYASVAS